MEAFFDAPAGGHGCASLTDLQQQLRQLLDSKVTPTKAEHLSVTFELRSNVTFSVPVTEAENASLEAGGGVEPRLFGGRRAGSTVTDNDGQLLRHVNALDTVLNQSHDDPVVQRVVSKHIMAGIGETDQSQWIMRSMTREIQGWTFTYGCKDSADTWARQVAKNPAKTLVGEWSNKDGQDPVNLSRPAFDCRGTLAISFSKSEKAISVKYEHTNMHKTVGELLDLLAPPPPRPQPIPTEGRKSLSKKTPKKRQAAEGAENGTETHGDEGSTPRPKRRKKPTQDGEQSSTPKKPSGKQKKDGDAQTDQATVITPLEMPGARPVGGSSARPLYNTQALESGTADGGAYPEGLVNGEPFNGSEAQASAMVSSSLHANSILNLPAGEAERRRETAIRLLADSGVDPKTLSSEQFSIFANQSPALQQESLAMLVQYGAERLRIVLPNKDQNTSTDSGPPGQGQQGASPLTVDAQQSATAADSPKRNGKASRKKAEAVGTDVVDGTAPSTQPDAVNRQKKASAPRLSRGACTPCRASKIKCGKEKPSCEQCLKSGVACSYPLAQLRKSKAAEQEAEEEPGAGEAEQLESTPEAAGYEGGEPNDLPSPGYRYEDPGAPAPHDPPFQPGVENDSESEAMQDNPQPSYGGSSNGVYHHSSGLTFPDSISPEITQQLWPSGATNVYNQTLSHGAPNNGVSLPQQVHVSSSTMVFPEQRSTGDTPRSHNETHQHQKAWGSYTTSKEPGGVTYPTTTGSLDANAGETTASWPADSVSDVHNTTKNVSASPRQSRRTAKPANAHSYSLSSASDGMHQGSTFAQAAMNSAATRTASPVQMQYEAVAAISRAKSRQGLKPPTRTPVPSQPDKQTLRSASAAGASNDYSTVSDKTVTPSYNNTYSQYSTGAGQSSNSVAYQPYSQHNSTTTASSSYSDYDSYGTRSHATDNTLPLNNSTSQTVTPSYSSASTNSTMNQWGDASSQPHNSLSNRPNSSTPTSSAVKMRSSDSQRSSQIAASFNVRPQAPINRQSRTAASANYGQAQTGSYNSYPSQAQQQSSSVQQQQQQGGYTGSSTSGYGTGTSRSSGTTNAGYPSTGTGSGSGAAQGNAQYGQQHRQQSHAPAHQAMNMSTRAYNSMNSAGEAMYNIQHGASGH